MKANDKDSVEIQLTTDGECYYGYADNIRRYYPEQKDESRDAVWFKNSKKLYIERTDERKVKDLFVIDVTFRTPSKT